MTTTMRSIGLVYALALLTLRAVADEDSSLRGSSPAGRRLSWGWCWAFWDCAPAPPGPQCAPACSNPCPDGFTYKEDCGYWWWDSDRMWCEPDTTPAEAVEVDADLEMRGWCSYAFTANGEGKFGSEPDKCPEGFIDGGVIEDTNNCCQPPIWARNNNTGNRRLLIAPISCDDPRTKPYGFFKTRQCIRETKVKVFKISSPSGGCPTWPMQEWQTSFETCQHCGEDDRGLVGDGRNADSCWLPYSKNADGNCFAYEPNDIGWWNKTGDSQFEVAKGGDEQLMPP